MGKKSASENIACPESELLASVASGNERAFGRLVDEWWSIVFMHVLAFTKSTGVAEEITLDIFEKLWRKREKLKDVENFRDWFYIFCRNQLISYSRKKSAYQKQALNPHELVDGEILPGKILELEELANLIKAGISRLKPHQQKIFLMSRQHGLTHEQIALKLGLSKHTVKGHMVNSLNFLRRFIQEHGGTAHCELLIPSAIFFF